MKYLLTYKRFNSYQQIIHLSTKYVYKLILKFE